MKKTIVALIILGFGTSLLHAQLMKITETSAKPEITLNLATEPIVDINAALKIEMFKDRLTDSISQNQNTNPELTAKLKALLYILQSQQEILKLLTPPTTGDTSNLKNLTLYSKLMTNFYTNLMEYPDLRQEVDTLFREAVQKRRNHTLDHTIYPTLQSYVIKNLSSITDKISADIQNSPGLSKINIQVVAFLTTKTASDERVHIENFDNYSEGEFYNVPRWVTTFSQDDVNQFNQISQISKDLNSQISTKFSSISKLIPDSLNSYICFSNLLSDLQKRVTALTGQAANELASFTNGTEKQVEDIYKAMQAFQQLKNNQSGNPLQQFNQVSTQFLNLANDLPNEIATLKNQLSATATKTFPEIDTINAELNNCMAVLKSDVSIVSSVYNIAGNLLQPFQSTANTAQKVIGNVFSFNIDKLPKVGYIDLRKTGKRENGDELVMKVIYQTEDDIAKNQPGQTLDKVTIKLQQINFYSQTNISVILTSPIGNNSNVTLKNKFQFAPAGSLLLKLGSRNSSLWNSISPGLGLILSTPDFNLDGTPDISYGLVMTLFQNILSIGLSYNTTTSSPFWFFGVSLPFANLGVPFGGVQTQKN